MKKGLQKKKILERRGIEGGEGVCLPQAVITWKSFTEIKKDGSHSRRRRIDTGGILNSPQAERAFRHGGTCQGTDHATLVHPQEKIVSAGGGG